MLLPQHRRRHLPRHADRHAAPGRAAAPARCRGHLSVLDRPRPYRSRDQARLPPRLHEEGVTSLGALAQRLQDADVRHAAAGLPPPLGLPRQPPLPAGMERRNRQLPAIADRAANPRRSDRRRWHRRRQGPPVSAGTDARSTRQRARIHPARRTRGNEAAAGAREAAARLAATGLPADDAARSPRRRRPGSAAASRSPVGKRSGAAGGIAELLVQGGQLLADFRLL